VTSLSFTSPQGTEPPTFSQDKGKASAADVGCATGYVSAASDKSGRQDAYCSHVSHAHAVMQLALIRWHLTQDIQAGAEYRQARRDWEAAMFDSIKANERANA
jgi:hypothetical protein